LRRAARPSMSGERNPVPSQNPKPEVTAALAEAERAIEAFAQAYAAVRRAMATTAPK